MLLDRKVAWRGGPSVTNGAALCHLASGWHARPIFGAAEVIQNIGTQAPCHFTYARITTTLFYRLGATPPA